MLKLQSVQLKFYNKIYFYASVKNIMLEKLFVIAIEGTGMRCLESFVHLCAILDINLIFFPGPKPHFSKLTVLILTSTILSPLPL